MALSQETRVAKLTTPLGTDVIVLERFDCREGLGELFEFHVDALSEAKGGQPPIDFDDVIGNNCCVSIKNYDESERHFNGVLTEAQWHGTREVGKETFHTYSLVLRPWLWMLSRVSDCHIFSDKTIPDIIRKIFEKHPFAELGKWSLEESSYPKLEYCVQYRETDLQFVCRLMEEAGIYYFFEHSESGHNLILADNSTACGPKQGASKLVYRPLTGTGRRQEEIHTWFSGRRFASGKFALKDYNYKKSDDPLLSEQQGGGNYKNSKLERYDYPGRFEDKDVGKAYAGFRLEAEQAMDRRCWAVGAAVSCCPGTWMELAEHPEESQNGEYLIVHAQHAFSSNFYRSGGGSNAEEIYSGHYEFLPRKIPFRMPQVTPKPVIHGPQTAKVASKSKDPKDPTEIEVDEHGRILVQFHWDREQKNEDKKKKNSRWVRIAQVWSGNKWGGIFIPRVGMEVVIEFIDGDPDRPLVTGTVYNDKHEVPYKLPKDKTIAGVKSNSSEGGGGYNELYFDDKAGSELIRLHGQKNMEATIENDVTKIVHNNQTETIDKVWTVTAGERIEFVVGRSKIVMVPESITIESITITIKAQALLDASSSVNTNVKANAVLTIQGALVKIN